MTSPPTPDERERDIALIHAALKFFVWGAGEGLSPPAADDVPEPETTLYEYSLETGDEDWDTLPDRIVAAVRPTPCGGT